MCVCMCMCVYLCICVCVYVCIYVYVYVCICVCVCMYMCVCMCMCVYLCVCVCVCIYVYVCLCVCISHTVAFNSVTPWTTAIQAALSMKFSRQEYQMGCHFLLQGTFLSQGSKQGLLQFRLSHQGKPIKMSVSFILFVHVTIVPVLKL